MLNVQSWNAQQLVRILLYWHLVQSTGITSLPMVVHAEFCGAPPVCSAVVLFNFRADRMVQMSKAFEYAEFNYFDRQRFPKVAVVCNQAVHE